jgi:DNA topoisomerase-1
MFVYLNNEYPYWGNPRGRNKTVEYDKGKFNRYAKLGSYADEIIEELQAIIEKGHNTDDGRCAFASLLMMLYGVRIGNEGSAEGYVSGLKKNEGEIVHTYGTTTLLNRHISFPTGAMMLDFLGKEQVAHNIIVVNDFLKRYGKLYHDPNNPDEKWLKIDYATLFKFIKRNIGEQFIPKDLRTFCANISAWNYMKKILDKPLVDTKTNAKAEVREIVEKTAKRLGNTVGICRRAYLDHRMLNWFIDQRYESS